MVQDLDTEVGRENRNRDKNYILSGGNQLISKLKNVTIFQMPLYNKYSEV